MLSIESPKKVTQKERKSSLTKSKQGARIMRNRRSSGSLRFIWSGCCCSFQCSFASTKTFLVQSFWERVVMFLRRPFSQSDSRCRSRCSNCWRITNLNFKFINSSEKSECCERRMVRVLERAHNHKDIEKWRQPIHKNNMWKRTKWTATKHKQSACILHCEQKTHTHKLRPWYSGSKERKTLPDWKLNQQNNSLKIWLEQTKRKICDEIFFPREPQHTHECVSLVFP